MYPQSVAALLAVAAVGCGASHVGDGGAEPTAPCRLVATREIASPGLNCTNPPAIAVDRAGAVHVAWVSTLPYSGHAAVREPGGEWTVREGAYGQARSVSLAAAAGGVHALVDGLETATALRPASGAEVTLSGMSGGGRRSIASGGDGRVHVLLNTLVEEPCTGSCSVAVLYRHGVARASARPEDIAPEEIALGELGASAIDVSARADGSAAFLFSIDGAQQVLGSDGTSTALELANDAHASALALGIDGSFHVLVREDSNGQQVLSVTSGGDARTSVDLDSRSVSAVCPSPAREGDLCDLDITRYDSTTLAESDEATYLVARASRTTGRADFRCGLPADVPDATVCDWRLDREPVVSLLIVRLSPGEPSEAVLVAAPELPVPWALEGTAASRTLHLVVLDGSTYDGGCAASEVEIDCSGL